MRGIIVAGVVAVALTGCTAAGPVATPSVPAPTPTSTVPQAMSPSPTATPRPTAKPTVAPPKRHPEQPPVGGTVIAGDVGHTPQGFTLPDEGRVADDMDSGFQTTTFTVSCLDRAPLKKLTASRIKMTTGPEYGQTNGLLVFADPTSATAFVTQVLAAYTRCPAQGGKDDEEFRTRQALDTSTAGLGEQGVRFSTWSEWNRDRSGTWVESPGGDITYFVRKGKFVAMSSEGAEYIGNTLQDAALTERIGTRIKQMLAQV